MSGYIEVPFEGDVETLTAEAFDHLINNIPGWVPQEGHLESWLIEALARMVAEARQVASRVPIAVFRYFGESILGLASIDAARAETTSTWTMIDNQGYTIPAGTVVAWRAAGDTLVPFEVVDAVAVPPGSAATPPDAVRLQSIDPGAAANSLPGGPIELVDALGFVDSIAAVSPSGGVDAETDDAYLNRLSAELELLAPRPILPADFAALSRRIPGVYRARAIDGYDPGDDSWDNERMVTVAIVAQDGSELPESIRLDVKAELERRREVNFVVHVIDPTYTDIDVEFAVVTMAGYEAAVVRQAVIDRVVAYLDPGAWGGGNESPPLWRLSSDTVRYLEVASTIDRVEGVDYVSSLTINGGTADVVLGGVAPLTRPGTVGGTAE